MNRTEFTKEFADYNQISIALAKECCKTLDFLSEKIKNEPRVQINNLGTFCQVTRKAKRVKVPSTGEFVNAPAYKTIVFRPAPCVMEWLNQSEILVSQNNIE